MKAMKTLALVSAAAIAAAGLAGVAAAEIKHSRLLEIRLPDGAQEQIRYVGDTSPIVRLGQGWAPFAVFPAADALAADSPFAALQRISAQMDREAAAVLQQAQMSPGPPFGGPDGLTQVDLAKLPPGVSGYSMISTMSGGRVCTRTTEYGPVAGSGRPKAVTRISGDCSAAARPSSSAVATARAAEPAGRPQLQRVSTRD